LLEVAAARVFAIEEVERSVKEYALDCDFRRVPFHLFSLEGGRPREEVEKECAAARNAGLPVSSEPPADFPLPAASLMSIPGQAQFDPFRYCDGLAEALESAGCNIYESSPV